MWSEIQIGMMHLQAKTCELRKGSKTNSALEVVWQHREPDK